MDVTRLAAAFLSLLPPILLGVGVYLGIRLGFFPFLHPVRTARALFGRSGEAGEQNGSSFSPSISARTEKKTSPFRAASVAIAGTIGVGNIAGVSLAILTGGAGAVFWMWVCGLLAMILKYAEITLAMDSRRPDGQGGLMGGTFFSMRDAGLPRMAAVFAVLMLVQAVAVGGMVQANAISDCLFDAFSCPPPLVGAVLVLMTLPITLGGGGSISAWTARLVPLMCLLYLLVTGAVILTHCGELPHVFSDIMASAFSPEATGGGIFGFLGSRAMRVGMARGLMSNEGGCGTAPSAHAASTEPIAARQGLFGILEVFADTIVVCTLTALAILTAVPSAAAGMGGMTLVREAFTATLGGAAPLLLAFMLTFFAYATILSASFYGESVLRFFGFGAPVCRGFAFFFCFFVFCGAVSTPSGIWLAADVILGVMALFNLFLLVKRTDRIVELTASAGYCKRRK